MPPSSQSSEELGGSVNAPGSVDELAAGQRVGGGRFRLQKPLGKGGMGMVWQAFDERLQEMVALKFLSERIRENDAALVAMRRETSRCHLLSHHGIVRTHDLHENGNEPAFISMEFVDGPNLHQLSKLEEKRAFPWPKVKEWLGQLCAALHYAHTKGVIHRDLKAANLMLNSKGELKLADFGLADALSAPHDAPNSFTGGTLAYMSPQQIAGAPCAVSDDIYSLGACLFELLTGVQVFTGPDIRRSIEFEPSPTLSETLKQRGIRHPVPEEVEDLIQQCLSKNPRNRPPSAEAVLELAGLTEKELAGSTANLTNSAAAHKGYKSISLALEIIAVAAILILLAKLFMTPKKEVIEPRSILDLTKAIVRGSSFEAAPFTPRKAFDGVHRAISPDEHRWVSAAVIGDHEDWIAVDLGADMTIERVAVDWELAYARDFTVRGVTSAQGFPEDTTRWTVLGNVVGFRELKLTSINDTESRDDAVFDFEKGNVILGHYMKADEARVEVKAPIVRHLMINATGRSPQNPGVYSIHEVEVAARPLKAER